MNPAELHGYAQLAPIAQATIPFAIAFGLVGLMWAITR